MPEPTERQGIRVQSERTVLAAVRLPDSVYDRADPFGELRSLAEQAGAVVVGELTQARERPEPAMFMGSGKADELARLCEALDASTIIFDHGLSPSQIGNIEERTKRKVLDRSELILDIFASRATTHEAKLQVELAQLEYTYPRLRAMWSHLERIVGSGGIAGIGTRGPGEQQLEIDRRLVQNRKLELKRELRRIQERKRREVRERTRRSHTVGIVGYTNAGKSTLFNALTSGGAYADDRVFATLMTRTREWDLGEGVRTLLSDTVGFVRDLPHNLIASFRATLEEATHADLLLIVLDVTDPAADLHLDTVHQTLDDLFADVREDEAHAGRTWHEPPRLLLLNKTDRLGDNRELLSWRARHPDAIAICAIRPESDPGIRELTDRVREAVRAGSLLVDLELPSGDGRTLALIENSLSVLSRDYSGDRTTLRVRAEAGQVEQLRAMGVTATRVEPPAEG